MYEAYERIFKALNLEHHLTARQLAKLLYPTDNQTTAYQRVAKNLQYLRKENLLKSKSYGLGKEDLWSFKPHPIIRELGYKTTPEIHTFKYEHERDCAEVFVALALSGKLWEWDLHKKLFKGIIPDRTAKIDGEIWYIEIERGKEDRVTDKVHRYMEYWRGNREPFKVLFLVQKMRDWQFPSHYQIELYDQWLLNNLTNSVPNEETDKST